MAVYDQDIRPAVGSTPDGLKRNGGYVPTPSKFRTTTRQRIIELLRAGASRARAARAVGIHPSTLSRWIERGRTAHPEGRWRAFHDAVLQAEKADPGLRAVRDEFDRMATDPSRALAYLERVGELDPPVEPLEIRVTFAHQPDTTRPKGDPA